MNPILRTIISMIAATLIAFCGVHFFDWSASAVAVIGFFASFSIGAALYLLTE